MMREKLRININMWSMKLYKSPCYVSQFELCNIDECNKKIIIQSVKCISTPNICSNTEYMFGS